MSDRHRAEMAESKLRAIRKATVEYRQWLVEATLPEDGESLLEPPTNFSSRVLEIIDAEVWDGYQTVDVAFTPPLDHKEP